MCLGTCGFRRLPHLCAHAQANHIFAAGLGCNAYVCLVGANNASSDLRSRWRCRPECLASSDCEPVHMRRLAITAETL
eukprot:1216016-Alexandrium_andersonii.AAC.1